MSTANTELEEAEADAAIATWEEQAAYYGRLSRADFVGPVERSINENIARTCRLAAESIRLGLQTGVPHCGCTDPPHPMSQHLLPKNR